MKVKIILLILNWVAFIIIALQVGTIINMVVSTFYAPNAPSSPYFSAIGQIWLVSIVTSFFLSLLLMLSSGRLSTRKILSITTLVYGILMVYALISFFLVKPIPPYFIQSVGDAKYQVPSEFVFSSNQGLPRDNGVGLRIGVCLQTLKGIYSPESSKCRDQSVVLSIDSVYSNSEAQLFFNQTKEFKLNGNQVVVLNSAKKYQAYSKDKLIGYTIDIPWVSQAWRSEVQNIELPIHLLIDDRNELVRFVNCDRKYEHCDHYIKTDKGTLYYRISDSINFDLKLWQATDRKLLNLISQWKVD